MNLNQNPGFDWEQETFPLSQFCTGGGAGGGVLAHQVPGAHVRVHATPKDQFENHILTVNSS